MDVIPCNMFNFVPDLECFQSCIELHYENFLLCLLLFIVHIPFIALTFESFVKTGNDEMSLQVNVINRNLERRMESKYFMKKFNEYVNVADSLGDVARNKYLLLKKAQSTNIMGKQLLYCHLVNDQDLPALHLLPMYPDNAVANGDNYAILTGTVKCKTNMNIEDILFNDTSSLVDTSIPYQTSIIIEEALSDYPPVIQVHIDYT